MLPIGVGDGVAFFARTDDAGNALDGRCTFLVMARRHQRPAGWTALSLYDARGRLVANTIDRHGFRGAEVARDSMGNVTITAAPRARPGNWLPSGGVEQFPEAGVAALRHADRRCVAHDQGRADADHCPYGLPMMRIALLVLCARPLGGIVHLSTVLAMPTAATQDAYSRLTQRTPVNAVVPLPAASGQDATMPFMDPAFAVAVCRYDLSAGTLKLHAPLSQAYTSVTFYTRNSVAYYAINDRAAGRHAIDLDLMTPEQRAQVPEEEDVTAADRLIIESPTQSGLIVLRALAPEPSLMAMARRALANAQCRIEPLPTQ